MEKPVSFTLRRFLQTNSFPREENTYSTNLSVKKQCTFDTLVDESFPNKNYYTSREIKRRKRTFNPSDEDFLYVKSVDKIPANSSKSPKVSSSVCELNRNRKYNAKYKYKKSASRTRRGSPKSVDASKPPRTKIYKYTRKNEGTKRLDDFLEENSQYVDENRLFKDLNIPKRYCKSKESSETSLETSDVQDNNGASPDSTMTLTNGSAEYVTTISDMGLKVISSPMGLKPSLKGTLEGRPSCSKVSKTPKLDEFLETFSQNNKVGMKPKRESSEKSETKENTKTESQKTMFSFFRKSKKYAKHPYKSSIGTGCRKRRGETKVFMDKENRKAWRKEDATIKQERKTLFTNTIESILKERKRKMERLKEGVTEEKRRHLVKERSCSDSSEDSITRKFYSRKPVKSIKTKSTDRATKKSPNGDHISSLLQSPSQILIDQKSGRNEASDTFKSDMMKAKSPFLLRKPLELFNRGPIQKYSSDKELFSQELQRSIEDNNIWGASSCAFQTSSLNLGQFEYDKTTDKNKKHKTFLRRSSSESNLSQNQHKNKPVPKLTFRKDAELSSTQNIRENRQENVFSKYSTRDKKEDNRHETSKEIDKDDLAASNFETMLRHMSKYIEYTTGNIFAQETKTGSDGINMVETSAIPATKSQKNLLSSEGFHETMSTETPIKNYAEHVIKNPVEKREIATSNNTKLALKGSSATIYEENLPVVQDSVPNPPLHNKKTSKDSLSDPLSLGSQPVIFSANDISCHYSRPLVNSCAQVRGIVAVQKPSDDSQNNSLLPNCQKNQQKKDKFDSQALKDLCMILEHNKWDRNFSVQNTHPTEKDPNKSAVTDRNICVQYNNEHATSQDKFPKLGPCEYGNPFQREPPLSQPSSETFCKHAYNSQLLQKASISAATLSQNVTTDDLDDNQQQQTQTNEDNAYLLTGEQDTQDNCEESNNILTEEENVVTQTQSFSQQQSAPKTKTCIRKKAYNITKDCILFGDNLLKELLEEKPQIVEAYNKNKAKIKSDEEADDVLAKTYIKRYKKGETKIFKIKRRLKVKPGDVYRAPEDHIIDRFTERLNNDFKDKSLSERDEDDSVSTPSSYVTVSDETKSIALSTGSTKLPKHQRLLREGVNKLSKNRDLLFSRYSDFAPKDFDSTITLNRIYEVLLEILDDYEQERELCLKFPKNVLRNYAFRDDRYQMAQMIDYTSVVYKLNRTGNRFNLLLFVLNKIRILLETGTKLTKRELYYQLKTMISYQSITDNAIRDISRILNVGVWALNLTAQKGLVYGNLKLIMSNGEIVNCNVAGTSVPKDVMDICEIQSDAYFILVVEKESVFHKLLEEDLPKRLTRPFIMITGKGFPDLNTQLFLKKLWMVMTIPVLILVDADPDGIAIMLNYRFGSMANAHVSEYLAIPKARWIGVFPSEINKLSLSFEILTKREITRTRQLLQLQCVQQNDKIREQLQTLLDTETKAGIESVMKTDTYLSHRYLSTKFYVNDLI